MTVCKLFLPGPVVDNARTDQKIILMVVGCVGESCEVVIDLNRADREVGIKRHIDSAADTGGESIGTVRNTSLSTARVSGAQEYLRERLRFMIPFQPGLGNL